MLARTLSIGPSAGQRRSANFRPKRANSGRMRPIDRMQSEFGRMLAKWPACGTSSEDGAPMACNERTSCGNLPRMPGERGRTAQEAWMCLPKPPQRVTRLREASVTASTAENQYLPTEARVERASEPMQPAQRPEADLDEHRSKLNDSVRGARRSRSWQS